MDPAIRVQILNEAVCILHTTYICGKNMNPTILHSAIGK